MICLTIVLSPLVSFLSGLNGLFMLTAQLLLYINDNNSLQPLKGLIIFCKNHTVTIYCYCMVYLSIYIYLSKYL